MKWPQRWLGRMEGSTSIFVPSYRKQKEIQSTELELLNELINYYQLAVVLLVDDGKTDPLN
jgi:hypothetical protein